jgi:coiled-coil domain-containing protein 12
MMNRTLVFKQRNFDPETRQSRKRVREDNEGEDTVEATVQGLTERIIAEDKAKRAEELVCRLRLTEQC